MIDWLIYLTYNFPCLVNKIIKTNFYKQISRRHSLKYLTRNQFRKDPNRLLGFLQPMLQIVSCFIMAEALASVCIVLIQKQD